MGQQASAPLVPPSASEPDPNPQVAWWCKLLSRGIACVGALIAIILGVWCCVSGILHPVCIAAGIIQIIVGLLVLVFEAPFCCAFIEITKPIGIFAERRTYWQKGVIYVILGIPAVALCFQVSTLFGSGLVFAAGVFYGLMGLGKKAEREEMMAKAGGEQDYMKLNLVNNEEGPAQEP